MKNPRTLLIILLLSLFHSALAAETDIEKTIIISCAYTDDEELQQKAIDTISSRYQRDQFVDEEIMDVVIYLAEFGITTRIYEDLQLLENNITININAIRLLGMIGGQQALGSISSIISSSENPRILLESIGSTTQFTASDYSEFLIILGQVMVNQHHINLDNMFAFTALSAIDHIVTNTDTQLNKDIVDIILTYRESAYIQKILDYSLEVLKKTYQ